jgi:hypothetical protein
MFSFATYFSSLISYYMQSWSFVFFHFTNKVKSWYTKIFKFNWLNTRLLDLKFEIFWDSTEEVKNVRFVNDKLIPWFSTWCMRAAQGGLVYKTSDFTNNFQSGCTWLPKSWELHYINWFMSLCSRRLAWSSAGFSTFVVPFLYLTIAYSQAHMGWNSD